VASIFAGASSAQLANAGTLYLGLRAWGRPLLLGVRRHGQWSGAIRREPTNQVASDTGVAAPKPTAMPARISASPVEARYCQGMAPVGAIRKPLTAYFLNSPIYRVVLASLAKLVREALSH